MVYEALTHPIRVAAIPFEAGGLAIAVVVLWHAINAALNPRAYDLLHCPPGSSPPSRPRSYDRQRRVPVDKAARTLLV